MDIQTFPSLIAIILGVFLILVVLSRSRTNKVARDFLLLAGALTLWNSGFLATRLDAHRLLWYQILNTGLFMIPPAGVQFVRAFIGDRRNFTKYLIFVYYLVSAVLIVLLFFFPERTAILPLDFNPPVPWIIFINLYILGTSLGCLVWAVFSWKKAEAALIRNRLGYLLAGTVFAIIGGITNFLAQINVPVIGFGHLGTMILLVFITLAVIKWRLLEIHLAIGRLLVYFLVLVLLVVLFYIIKYFIGLQTTSVLFIGVLLLGVFAGPRFTSLLRDLVIRIPGMQNMDIRPVLEDATHRFALSLDIQSLAGEIKEICLQRFPVSEAALWVRDENENSWRICGENTSGIIHGGSPIIDWLEEYGDILISEEIERARFMGESIRGSLESLNDLNAAIKESGWRNFIPVRVEDDLRAIISYNLTGVGSALTITELRALTLIAGQCGVALDKIGVYEKLRKADRLAAIGGMTAAVAHEIKNPLGSMKGAVQLLADSEIPSDSREYVRIISEEINRLNGLVQDFLQFARPLNLEPVPEAVPDVIWKSVELLKRDSRLDGVEIVVQSDENIPDVNIDAEKIRQVIINLLMNAAESMNWRGRIVVKSEFQAHLIDTEWVVVTVTDNGPGVPEEAREHLFEPFFTTRTQGSGLGLAISRQIIEGHGGRLRLDADYKAGARFIIELPPAMDV